MQSIKTWNQHEITKKKQPWWVKQKLAKTIYRMVLTDLW